MKGRSVKERSSRERIHCTAELELREGNLVDVEAIESFFRLEEERFSFHPNLFHEHLPL
jgi:hypothetical protein